MGGITFIQTFPVKGEGTCSLPLRTNSRDSPGNHCVDHLLFGHPQNLF